MSKNEYIQDQKPDEWTEDEWEDYVNSEYLDEENNILGLVECELPFQNFFNTFVWANDFYQRTTAPIQPPAATYVAEALDILPKRDEVYFWDTGPSVMGTDEVTDLEQAFNKIGGRWYPTPLEKHYRFQNPLEVFLDYVNSGGYPPPEIIASVAKCFNLYLKAEGNLSLEEVFFGKPKKRSGNYAFRQKRYSSFKEFHYSAIREKEIHPDFNLEDFARRMMNASLDDENPFMAKHEGQLESFLRAYHRWKSKLDSGLLK